MVMDPNSPLAEKRSRLITARPDGLGGIDIIVDPSIALDAQFASASQQCLQSITDEQFERTGLLDMQLLLAEFIARMEVYLAQRAFHS